MPRPPSLNFLPGTFVALGLGISLAASAGAKPAEREALKRSLQSVLTDGALKGARVSMEVLSLDDGSVVFANDADALLNPASNVKLFTAASSLVRLGPEYRFQTEFLADNVPEDGKIKTLYVRGKGDPSITTERLYGIVGELAHLGLKEVSGDLLLDDSWFDPERLAPGFDQEKTDRAYMAPTGALSLNWNSVGVYLRSSGSGKKPSVEIEPASDYFVLDSALLTRGRRARRFSVTSEPQGDKQRILVRGTIPEEAGEWTVWKKIDHPPLYFGYTLKRMLADRGIKVKGKVRLGRAPERGHLLYVAQSETFDLVLKRMNKLSSNFVAEQLLKTMAAEVKGAPGSFPKGVEVVEEFLEKEVGIARGTYVMKNGSGLNDTNRFSAAQISRLLRYMYDRFPLAPEYLSSMGIAGKDGTLRYRFEGTDAVGRLRAKTGTLENVSALSGYVQAVGGDKFAFSVIVNDYVGRSGPVVRGIDALGAAVASLGAGSVPSMGTAAPTLGSQGDEVKTRIRTYLNLGAQKDARNIAFLRTAWRTENDAAVRAVVAQAIYLSAPQDFLGARALLDSFSAQDAVYGRLRQLAKELKVEVPAVSSIVELAAEGNTEAVSRLVELARATGSDEQAQSEIAESLAEVSRTAGEELVLGLHSAPPADREPAVSLLARGLVKAAESDHPFWSAVRKVRSSTDPQLSAFAKGLEESLSLKIAAEKAPREATASSGQKTGDVRHQ